MKTTDNTTVETLEDLAPLADYSLINTLNIDPDAREDGIDHDPRQVFSGHFVPVNPTRIKNPKYVAHSKRFFSEFGLSDSLATSEPFMKMFSGNTSELPESMRKTGWATGYALSIYGTEYYDQCPFRTGNGYGDGRAVSIFEGVLKGKRWEMQLKGGGRTPYCRGGDGRAVLRSSVREFLAQEHMHALGIPTSRSLTLYASETETVSRPWFHKGSYSKDPELMIDEAVAISTRVAPSFLRVGQLELFGRRARKNEHPTAMKELEQMVLHIIEREYSEVIDESLSLDEKVLLLAIEFRKRLTLLIANWIRVGYCQGNFNSDNCAVGGYTIDYGPFGFIDMFDPRYQPWTGGGVHYSFLNQPKAAERNFQMFCLALKPLLASNQEAAEMLEKIKNDFPQVMQARMLKMWASKLGLKTFDTTLFNDMMRLMIETSVDYTIFFRELSSVPEDMAVLAKSFYGESVLDAKLMDKWSEWFTRWQSLVDVSTPEERKSLSEQMKAVNPKYTLREWLLVPAYRKANHGDYALIHDLQEVMNNPYAEQSEETESKYYREKPAELFDIAGVSHVSCSS
ncbi:MAG: Selenoprotein O and cysteine-containing homologs [uncultured Sulfurovum sp.]|uniref:Protein nucleotidyltransferase YdiU n=1 Tax=uncultured Sulfurovum sp. TaxID=269237 RepID=A0A6S6S9M6_9BACT|nr:MAG: Selenoprotein O and cysteine-containing homologs [uncultured Sulfurovum sp.]